jgi:glycosyltransferase involved in cell wall biosynthesis
VIVATAWPTAGAVTTYGPDKGCKFYLLQHYETFTAPEDLIRATWMLPLHKIAIARWLKDTAEEMGESAAYIPNGLDFDAFGCDITVRQRTSPTVTMPYHENVWKGSADGIQALRMIQRVVPDLKVRLFGIDPKPKGLPGWMTYIYKPAQSDLRNLYNQSTVFLAPSWKEGWPLPPAEAMTCGASLVCTDIPGHDEYAVDGRNAFVAQPHDPQSLAEALVRALKEKSTRFAYAEQAISDIRRFTWDAATDRLETEFSWRVADAAKAP